jgi:hypothetical protein
MHIPASCLWNWSGRDIILTLGERMPEFIMLAEKSKKTRGGYLSFDIDLPRRPRSTGVKSQNHHLGGHVEQLAMAARVSISTMKTYIKTRAALEFGYRTETIDGQVYPISEADASVEECSSLIEICHIVASEKGFSLYEGDGWEN